MPSLYINPQGSMIHNALIHVFNHNESCISHASIKHAEWSFIIKCFRKVDMRTIMLTVTWTNSRLDSYLSGSFGLVVVIVGGQVDVFVDAVQQPQEELQGVVLGVTTKLGPVLGHNGLQEQKWWKCHFSTGYIIMSWVKARTTLQCFDGVAFYRRNPWIL